MSDVDTLLANSVADPSSTDVSMYKNPQSINPYKLMDDAYFEEGGFADGTYLTPHQREMFYTARRETSTYKNFVKPILDAMINPVFAAPIPREVDPNSLFASFIQDTDNNGMTMDCLVSEAIHTCIRHGQVFVIIDNFGVTDQPETLQQARKDRVFPYVVIKTALDVADYTLDKWGNLITITFIAEKRQIGKDTIQLYRKWTKTDSQIVMKKGDAYIPVDEPVIHGLGVLPVITVYRAPRRDKTKLLVTPPYLGITKLSLGIYNKESEIRDLERAQSFSVLCVQSDRGGNITLGSRNVLYIPVETTIAPQFISPNPSILVGLMVNAEKMRDDMYKLAEQSGVTAVKSEASGVAEAYKFFGHETVLQKGSQLSKDLDQAIFDLFCLYVNETTEYKTEYPVDFAPGNISVEVDTLDKYLKQDLPDEAKALALKKWTRLIFGDQDPEEVNEALEAIDKMAEPEEASTIEPPSQGMPTESPEEQASIEEPEEMIEDIKL